MQRRRTAPLTALVLSLALTLAGCGDTDSDPDDAAQSSSSSPTESATDEATPEPTEDPTEQPTEEPSEEPDAGTRVEITREGGSISPNGRRVEAAVGEPITLVITADEAGEMHVHSTPEQDIAYAAGTSEHEVVIDRPGVVEIESHDPDLVVLQLEVR